MSDFVNSQESETSDADLKLSDDSMSILKQLLTERGISESDEIGSLLDIAKLLRRDDSSDEEDEEIQIKYDTYNRINKSSSLVENDLAELQLALVLKHHSLWAEFVYNAARILADRIDTQEINCFGKKCLELGAGAGLPGLMAALNGATEVVISDYGHEQDMSLVVAIDKNIDFIRPYVLPTTLMAGAGYVWGNPVLPLLNACHVETNPDESNTQKFDIIFLADLIFNRSEHKKLLWTVKQCLHPEGGVCWVTYSHHDPQKADQDLNFFRLAESEDPMHGGFQVERLGEETRPSYPFVENDGMDTQRGVIYICKLTLKP